MTSHTTKAFREAFDRLPADVQKNALRTYRLWRANPSHKSLQFKQVHAIEPVYSVRIGLGWRAPGMLAGDTIVWFWIGSHAEYDRLVAKR